jgi:hypothetical protein
LGFLEEDILSFFFWLPWQPEFCMECNSLNNFVKASHKEHPCGMPWGVIDFPYMYTSFGTVVFP